MKVAYFGMLILGILVSSPSFAGELDSPAAEAVREVRVTNPDFETIMRPEPESFFAVARIPRGTSLEILGRETLAGGDSRDRWCRVEYDGQKGWVRESDFEDDEPQAGYSIRYVAPYTSSKPVAGMSF
ncbi:MAG: SH3 domain-containing protein [Candidatus Omnitrophica bacterium]|nr:SH3 domain-containing protein [Candidatus Omnitrophota bacterium]